MTGGQCASVLSVLKCTEGLTANPVRDACLAGGGRGFLGREGSWWRCWAGEESSLKQMLDEPGMRKVRSAFVAVRVYQTDIQICLLCMCIYLQQGRLHGWVVETTKGSRGGRGREAWNTWEGQQAREPTASWRLESTTEPAACRSISIRLTSDSPNHSSPWDCDSTGLNSKQEQRAECISCCLKQLIN